MKTLLTFRVTELMLIAGLACAVNAIGQSALLSPEPGTTFTSSTVTFTWENVGAADYLLYVGTTQGSADIFNSGFITSTSQTVTGLPTTQVVHVRVWSRVPNGSSYYVTDHVFNVDIDGDGIDDTIDPHPGHADLRRSYSGVVDGDAYTLALHGSGRLASLEVPSALYDSVTHSGATSTTITKLSRIIYEQLRDEFDFIVLISNEDRFPAGARYSGIHFGAKNDIAGLNQGIFNLGSSFGSGGRLQSVIHLVQKSGLRGGPSLHELVHRWANSGFVPTSVAGHWGFSNAGGQLGGWAHGTLQSLGGNLYRANNGRASSFGTFANGGNSLPYSPLELYLMGLVEAAEVHDIQYALNAAYTANAGEFTASSIETRTMAQLVAQHGQRVPGVAGSPKAFSVLWLVLTKGPLSNGRWLGFDRDVYDFVLAGDDGDSGVFNFWEATGGRARLISQVLQQTAKDYQPPSITITAARVIEGRFEIEVPSAVGTSYSLERTLNLGATLPWPTIVANTPGSGQNLSLVDENQANAPAAFYRVRAVPSAGLARSPGLAASAGHVVGLPEHGLHCRACEGQRNWLQYSPEPRLP